MSSTDSASFSYLSATPEATAALAARLAVYCPDSAVIHLEGELGAGKSVFARAFLQTLGVSGPIKSPTYAVLETYAVPNGRDAVHMDLYRIADPDELDYLAIDGLLEHLQVLLVEWPQHGADRLPPADLGVIFSMAGNSRALRLNALSPRGHQWLMHLNDG